MRSSGKLYSAMLLRNPYPHFPNLYQSETVGSFAEELQPVVKHVLTTKKQQLILYF